MQKPKFEICALAVSDVSFYNMGRTGKPYQGSALYKTTDYIMSGKCIIYALGLYFRAAQRYASNYKKLVREEQRGNTLYARQKIARIGSYKAEGSQKWSWRNHRGCS